MTAREVAMATSANSMVLRRWLGAWVDFLALFLLFFAAAMWLGDRWGGLMVITSAVLIAAYFIVLEAKLGWTLGKLAGDTRIVNDEGKPPGFKAAILRTLLRLFEVNPFLLGGIPAGIAVNYSKARQRLGDMVANTYVIPRKDVAKISLIDPSVFE